MSLYISKFITDYNWKNRRCTIRKICAEFYSSHSPKTLQMTKNQIYFHDDCECLFALNRPLKGDMAVGCCDSMITNIVHCNNVIISSHE